MANFERDPGIKENPGANYDGFNQFFNVLK